MTAVQGILLAVSIVVFAYLARIIHPDSREMLAKAA